MIYSQVMIFVKFFQVLNFFNSRLESQNMDTFSVEAVHDVIHRELQQMPCDRFKVGFHDVLCCGIMFCDAINVTSSHRLPLDRFKVLNVCFTIHHVCDAVIQFLAIRVCLSTLA